MILKMFMKDREDVKKNMWSFVDNVESVIFRTNPAGEHVVDYKRENDIERTSLVIDRCVYVMNDKGQTIDTFHSFDSIGDAE